MRDAAVRAGGWGVPAAVLAVAGVLSGSAGAVQAGVLGLGLLAVGLPHGALDHLLAHGRLEPRVEAGFVARYLGAAFGLLGVWLVAPAVARLVFLLYSAWHFGQADVVQWRVGRGGAVKAWAWGCGLLAILLLGHPGETRAVIALLGADIAPAAAQFAAPPGQPGARAPRPPALPGLAARRAPEPIPADDNANLSPTPALFDAITRGDLTAARDAVNRGADLNGRNALGLTPTDWAVDQGRNDILFYLLSALGMAGGSSGQSNPRSAAGLSFTKRRATMMALE
jgi:hypothetical protein